MACQISLRIVLTLGGMNAQTKLLIGLSVRLLLLRPALALAAHGKAGLWNVSTTMNMANMQMPPEAMAQMKKAGVAMPIRPAPSRRRSA